ncbi:alpha/beta fold hydrolase [Methylobacter sp. G7]|uniref:alpha/beta hydrolase n=1 Tax=Methylobacter sp. G7 TaxID=3230117 RepID=UPI003D8057C7
MPTFKPMLSILLTYLLLLLIVFLFQRKMIYFPDTYSIEGQQQRADQANLKLWPSTDNYRGLIAKTPNMTSKGTVIVFHGNAGSATDRTYYLDALENQGYRVILAEYPGYAARNGEPSEQALIADGIQTAQQALNDFGGPVFLWGESLGGGVACGIVQSGQVPVKGIVLVAPFNSMADIAQHHYWFFPAKWLIKDKFDNIKNLQDYSGNTAILLAEKDEIIPNKHSLMLFAALHHPKKLWSFKDASHNSLPLNQALLWWQEVMQFVSGQNEVSP